LLPPGVHAGADAFGVHSEAEALNADIVVVGTEKKYKKKDREEKQKTEAQTQTHTKNQKKTLALF
jgi:hypothetical protein